jgi:carboxymethylenebutenolidase
MAYRGWNEDPVEAFLARPLGPGPFPGVVIAHHIRGWDPFIKESAMKLAYRGFATLSPNFFTREAPDADPEEASMAVKKAGGVEDRQAVADTEFAISWLRKSPISNGKVGIIGWCLGGRQAYLTACQVNLDAAVDIYGGSVTTSFGGGRFCEVTEDELFRKHPVVPVTLTEGLSCRLLMLTGAQDRVISAEMLAETEDTLRRLGKRYECHIYANAGHEYMNPYTTEYRVEATVNSWERITEFFKETLS